MKRSNSLSQNSEDLVQTRKKKFWI